MESTVKSRLIEFLGYKKIGQNKFGLMCGLSSGFVSTLNKSIQPKTLELISAQFPELNTAWLILGQGEMLNGGEGGKEAAVKPVEAIDPIVDSIMSYSVPLLPVSAHGGNLTDFAQAVRKGECESVISPVKGADFALTVTGESMSPEYPNGSRILIKKINENSFIEWGRVYVIDTMNGVVIKILNEADDCECLLCSSIHNDQLRYAPFKVPKADILGVYRVMLCMAIK